MYKAFVNHISDLVPYKFPIDFGQILGLYVDIIESKD